MRHWFISLLALAMTMGFVIPAAAQMVTVDEDGYPHWQITDAVQDSCNPSVAYARFSGLDTLLTYIYTVRMYRDALEPIYYGQVYNPDTKAWVQTYAVDDLPRFTTGDDPGGTTTSFFVAYRSSPDMDVSAEENDWYFSVNVAPEGGWFSADLNLPLTVGSRAPGPFAMGFIEGVETGEPVVEIGEPVKIAKPGPAKRILLARRSPPLLGMYMSENNEIEEGYEGPEGFFRMAVPEGKVDTLEVRELDNSVLTILPAELEIVGGETTIVYVDLTRGVVFVPFVIPLNQGRNLVSIAAILPDSSVASVMAPILDSLVAVRSFDLRGKEHGQGKNGLLKYDPNQPSPHNTLRWIQPGFGYCINTLAVDDTLKGLGSRIPGDTPLELNRWWNLVAYLPESSMDVPTALESIGGDSLYTRKWTGSYRVVRGFDLKGIEHGQGADGALTFDPTLPEHFSTLKLMMNNFGYWIKIKGDATDTTLVYPVGGGLAKAVVSVQLQYPRSGDFTFTPTFEWVDFYGTATVDGHPVMPGDVVTVYDPDGVQCGGFVVHTEGMIGFIPVYGDDKATPGVDEGAEEGDRLSFFINDRPAEDSSQGSLVWTRDGDIRQMVLSVVGVGSLDVPREYVLYQNRPNPFNLGTEIVYQLPEESHVLLVVYNLMGQVVRILVDDSLSAGSYKVLWDGRDEEGVEVGSGIYFCRMNAQAGSGSDEFVSVRRMVVLK